MRKMLGPLVGLITLTLCLLLAEVGLRIVAPVDDPYESFKTRRPVNQFIRSKFPLGLDLWTEVEEGLPGVSGKNRFTTNSSGFRGDPLTIPKPHEEHRIFMIGGSSTECFYLDDADALPAVLQDELNERLGADSIKVYGAGKSGDRSDDHISMLVHRVVHLEPDSVIIFAGINDLSASIYGFDYTHLELTPAYVTDKRPVRRSLPALVGITATEFQIPRRLYYLLKRVTPSSGDALMQRIDLHSNYRQLVQQRKSTPVSDTRPRTDLPAYRRNLETIAGVAAAHDIDVMFMTQQTTWNSNVDPEVDDWQWMLYRNGVSYRADYMDEALESLNDVMREVARDHKVPLYDLARSMPKSLEYFYDDVHFNVNGAREAARGLASAMVENRWIHLELEQD